MSSPYTQQVIKVIVAQVCQTIGWNSIQSTPLELLGDILHKYLQEISHQTHRYSELYGRSEPNLDDVGLAFRDMTVSISDLEEYVANVDPVPCAIDVPKFPLQKENHLNFLKPGSKEVVTRPVHIHEHLPPIFPDKEEKDVLDFSNSNGNEQIVETDAIQKDEKELYSQPADISEASRLRSLNETEVRLTREITSVMMTTSGFISPAREGKLPDSKAPPIQHFEFAKPVLKEPTTSGLVGSTASVSLPQPEKVEKSKKKKPSPAGGEKDRKEKVAKELFRPKVQPMGPPPPKQMPSSAGAIFPPSNSPMAAIVENQIQQTGNKKSATQKAASNRKHHKRKDPNKAVGGGKVIDGKISKKRKKLLDKKKTFDMSLLGVEPIVPPNLPMDRPLTPDIPKELLQADIQRGNLPMAPIYDVIPGPSSVPEIPATIIATPDVNVKSQFEGKIASEPDKRKLNIIKRISSKNKEEIKIPQLNPETSIFLIDDRNQSFGPPMAPMPRKKPKQLNAANMPRMKNSDQPLNMSIPKGTDLTVSSLVADFPIVPKKEPKPKKIREKKPPKVREKKSKQTPMEWLKPIAGPGSAVLIATPTQLPAIPPPPPIRKFDHLPPTLGNIDDPYNHFANIAGAAGMNQPFGGPGQMFNWPPFAAGPSLIPNSTFYPPFNMNRPPFGPGSGLPPFGLLPNADLLTNDFPPYKRTRLDVSDQISALPIHTEKAQCNVAPLVPASLKLEDMDSSPIGKHRSPPHTPSIDLTDDGPLDIVSPIQVPIKSETSIKSKQFPPAVVSARPSSASSSFSDSSTVQKFTSKRDRSESPAVRVSPMDLYTPPSTDVNISSDTGVDVPPPKDKTIKSEKRKDKEHRKERKDKDLTETGNVKLKKKKDKKDKTKNKEKSEKRKEKEEKKREKELKEKTRKEKREKKKEKERAAVASAVVSGMATGSLTSSTITSLMLTSEGGNDSNLSTNDSETSIPKLTLKLGASPRPNTPDYMRKLTIKPTKRERGVDTDVDIDDIHDSDQNREPSPELARISALFTRPPKQKTSSTKKKEEVKSSVDSPIKSESISDAQMASPIHAASIHKVSGTPTIVRGRPKSSATALVSPTELAPATIIVTSTNPSTVTTPTTSTSPINFAVKTVTQRKMNPPKLGDSKSSTKLTAAGTSKSNTKGNILTTSSTDKQEPTTSSTPLTATNIRDSEGNQVWICPACGRVDDGTPMIGCDGCDAWYHWVCVGIQVPPDTNEDWYCRVCIAKKQDSQGVDKKKKRKKKDKKEH